MLTISAPIFDINGFEVIESFEKDGLSDFQRRVSRTATLDGGASITDFGYSDADLTFNIEWTPKNSDQVDNVRRMVRSYGRLIISFYDGCFLAAPLDFRASTGTVALTFLVEKRLSQ